MYNNTIDNTKKQLNMQTEVRCTENNLIYFQGISLEPELKNIKKTCYP